MRMPISHRAQAGKYLLALFGAALLFGLVAGEAAALTVKGTVMVDGAPAIGLFVVVTEPSPSFKFLGEAKTDGAGNYTIPGMPDNTKLLVFVDTSDTSFVWDPADPNSFIEKEIGPTTGTVTVDFKLVEGGPLTGKVTDSTGTPALPAPKDEVVVFGTYPDHAYKFIGQISTKLGVTYTLFAAPKQTAELAVDAKGTAWADLIVDPVFIRKFLETVAGLSGFDFTFKFGITVTGTVRAETAEGPAVGGALVEAFFIDPVLGWIWLDDSVTDSFGKYSVKVKKDLGKIVLRVTHKDFLEKRQEVTWSKTTSDSSITVDIVLTKAPVKISGKVTDAVTGKAVGGAYVAALKGGVLLAEAPLTDSLGNYSLTVPANSGTVTVLVDASPFYEVAKQDVTVGTLDLTVNFALVQPPPPPPPPGADTVTITKAVWSKGLLTVFADSTAKPGAVLTATVKAPGFLLTKTMTFSSKRNQYELRERISIDLNGGTVEVSSDKGGKAGPVTIPFNGSCSSSPCK